MTYSNQGGLNRCGWAGSGAAGDRGNEESVELWRGIDAADSSEQIDQPLQVFFADQICQLSFELLMNGENALSEPLALVSQAHVVGTPVTIRRLALDQAALLPAREPPLVDEPDEGPGRRVFGVEFHHLDGNPEVPRQRGAQAGHEGRWRDDALCRPESRARYRELLYLGYTDAIAARHPEPGNYTFWDYQAGAWQKNNGLRIDHLALSPQAADRLADCGIDKRPRGKEKPSDHVPVWCDLEL